MSRVRISAGPPRVVGSRLSVSTAIGDGPPTTDNRQRPIVIRLLKKRTTILLLDDDPSMHRLVKAILTREGFKVDAFLTGRQAIAAIDGGEYAALLLDLMMPHEGGMTVIRHLRRKNP